jgi:aminoglycoside phosphotransferase (APT) family kinase protein
VTEPTAEDACRLAGTALGVAARSARRFTTGLQHFVYEVILTDGRAVVARLSDPRDRELVRSAVSLSRQLRPIGVPLPELLCADADAALPWMLLERLPGSDLGDLVGRLPEVSLRQIAERVAAAQIAAGGTQTAGSYGFSQTPEAAPFANWSELVLADIARSRGRIANAGLFDLAMIDRLDRLVAALKPRLDAIPATPFLHDTTTKNVIVTNDGRFSGIVDVDDLCFGDPRFVTALTHVALRAHDLPSDYAGYLMEAAGWDDDELYRLYIVTIFVGFMSEHGQRFNGNEPPSSRDERQKLLALYDDALRDL